MSDPEELFRSLAYKECGVSKGTNIQSDFLAQGRMMPNNAINSDVRKRRFALLLPAGYGERYCAELRSAFWQCDLGAELSLVAVLRPSTPDPNQKHTTDRYQKGGSS